MQVDFISLAIGLVVGLCFGLLIKLSELKKLNLNIEDIGVSLGVEGFRKSARNNRKQIVGNIGKNFSGQAVGGSIGGSSESKKRKESSDIQVVGNVRGNFTGQAAGQDINQSQTIGSLRQTSERDITHKQVAGRDINHTSNLYQTVQAAAREALKGEGKDILKINKPIRFNAVVSTPRLKEKIRQFLDNPFEIYVECCINLPEIRENLLNQVNELKKQGWRVLELRAIDQISGGLLVEFTVEKLFDISN
jgi:hypothetical protein